MSIWLQQSSFARAYDRFFGPYGLGPMPDTMHYVCCAQFLVSRDRILARGRTFYEKAMQYLLYNDLRGARFPPGPAQLGSATVSEVRSMIE